MTEKMLRVFHVVELRCTYGRWIRVIGAPKLWCPHCLLEHNYIPAGISCQTRLGTVVKEEKYPKGWWHEIYTRLLLRTKKTERKQCSKLLFDVYDVMVQWNLGFIYLFVCLFVYCLFVANIVIKVLVHPKTKILSLITHPHVVPNP